MSAANRTLLVDGTDLRTLAGVSVTRLDIRAPGTRKGSADDAADAQGQWGSPLPLAAYQFTVSIHIVGSSDADLAVKENTVGAAVAGTNGLVALIRHRPFATTPFYVAQSAKGQFVGFSGWEDVNECESKVDLQFLNLDGAWWDSGTSTWFVP